MIIISSFLLSSTASPEPISESSDSSYGRFRGRRSNSACEGSETQKELEHFGQSWRYIVPHLLHRFSIWYGTAHFPVLLVLYSLICVPLDALCIFEMRAHQETHPLVLFVACLWLVWISNPVNSKWWISLNLSSSPQLHACTCLIDAVSCTVGNGLCDWRLSSVFNFSYSHSLILTTSTLSHAGI